MNLMDLIPVDFLPELTKQVSYASGLVDDPNDAYFKFVPTTDPNITLGMALGVFILTIFYSIKIKAYFWIFWYFWRKEFILINLFSSI